MLLLHQDEAAATVNQKPQSEHKTEEGQRWCSTDQFRSDSLIIAGVNPLDYCTHNYFRQFGQNVNDVRCHDKTLFPDNSHRQKHTDLNTLI